MKVKDYDEKYEKEVKKIFSQHWTDNEFLDELSEELEGKKSTFYIAQQDDEVVGIAGLRVAPEHLHVHTGGDKIAELYIIASKYQNKGIGTVLGQKIIEEAKKLGFTEVVVYSPETHSSSWKFYEKVGFTRLGIIKDPDDGYPGMLWQKNI